jgi:choline dehydrogenase-like flavoprotein
MMTNPEMTNAGTTDPDSVDVVIVGAGPSGAVAAHTLALRGFSVVCLEQGDWINPDDLPGSKPEFELLMRGAWAWDPNVRGRAVDYPLNVDAVDGDLISMFGAVGGSSVLFGAHWLRMLPSDFRVRTLDGICDDWPISYEDVDPFYREVDEFLGVSGLGGDPAYPEQDFPLPPHPIGPAGVRMAEAMNKLGWHWWPGTHAIPSSAFKNMAQCVRWGVCERGCPAGAKASFDIGSPVRASRESRSTGRAWPTGRSGSTAPVQTTASGPTQSCSPPTASGHRACC